jgi:hypothetical protein
VHIPPSLPPAPPPPVDAEDDDVAAEEEEEVDVEVDVVALIDAAVLPPTPAAVAPLS